MPGPAAKSILFLAPYPRGRVASQRFRFELFYDALDAADIAYQFQSFWDEDGWAILYRPGGTLAKAFGFLRGILRRTGILFTLRRYDVVYVHREVVPLGPPVFEWMITRLFGTRLIYDFDDAIWLPNVSQANASVAGLKWFSKTATICKWATRTICGNDYLAEYARRFCADVVVIPTLLETDGYHVRAQTMGDSLVIGWTGSHSTVPYLEPIVPALKMVAEGVPFRFRLIADRRPDFDIPNLEFVKWSKDTEIDDLSAIDVGLMPIPDTEWARGKCGFKILQYMAMGIPTIAAPVGVNRNIIDNGVDGWLASTNDEWAARLRELATDPELRRRMGLAAREKVVKQYSVKVYRQKFLAALIDL